MKSTIIAFTLFAITFCAPVRRRTDNVQSFAGALGGIAATPVEDSGNPDRPLQVKDDTFVGIGAALARSCDQQFNACANAANGGDANLSVSQCSNQKDQCSASIQASTSAAQGDAQAGAAGGASNGGNADASEVNAGNANSGMGSSTNSTANVTSCT